MELTTEGDLKHMVIVRFYLDSLIT